MATEKNTLLAALWNTDGDAEQAAESVIRDLETGQLSLTGNFRNWREEENADFWRENEE
jgi:hypothetical protein